ncbi:MAG: hypothetical protein AAGJ10_10590 [Bacteroidota bacterium]
MLEALVIALVIYFGAPAVRSLIDAVKNDPLAPPRERPRMQAPPRPSPYTTTVRQRQTSTAPASTPRSPYDIEDARFRDIR